MFSLPKLEEHELLSQKVYRILKEAIITQKIPPGTKILESKLAAELGISRTPVREALRKLAVEGFVELKPNQGASVSQFSIEDMIEVLQIREALECLAVKLAAENAEKNLISKLDEVLLKMETLVKEEKALEYAELDAQFHKLIWNACGNKRLMDILEKLTEQIHRYRVNSLVTPGRLKVSFKDHKLIFEAIKQGNSLKAEKAMKMHVNGVLNTLLSKSGVKEH